MEKLIDKLLKNEIFNEIDTDTIEQIISEVDYYINKYNSGEIIAQEEEECNALGFILSGNIEIKRIYSCGKEIILSKFGVGEVFGEALVFSKNHNYPATIEAIEESEIFYINKVDMIKLCSKYEKILENFMALLSNKVILLNSKIKRLSFKSIKHKIVDYILEERKKYESNRSRRINDKHNPFRDLDYICCSTYGKPRSIGYVQKHFKKLLKENDLPDIRFHDLRHSCASLLLARNVPMKAIQEWLGHSDFSTTANVYAHLDINSKLLSA